MHIYFINALSHAYIQASKCLRGLAVVVLCSCIFKNVHAVVSSDMLLHIVEQCTQTNREDYCDKCLAPQATAMCPGKATCRATSEIWRETSDFVAMRDIKMCGCPAPFVHGLVLPKSRVTGVEDPKRPEAIWQFAWDMATERMSPHEIALAVNPRTRRSQNQLHVHLVRLKPEFQDKNWEGVTVHTQNLTKVWELAAGLALANAMQDYGVLVKSSNKGGYVIVLTAQSPEALFTQAYCTS
jgi:CDP-diacylglycerol pyrophosphatase